MLETGILAWNGAAARTGILAVRLALRHPVFTEVSRFWALGGRGCVLLTRRLDESLSRG